MKILKYLVATIVVLMVVFLAIGFLIPSVDYGHKITVNKPLEEAWAVAQDESKYDQWLEGFQSIVLIEGEKGTVGSRYKVVVNPGDGQPDFVMTETVVSIEEFDHVSLSFDSEMMDFEQTISYSSEDGATTIVTDSKVMGKGLTMRSMFALMEILGGAFQKQEAKNIDALKMVIEKNTTDYYPIQIEDEVVLEGEVVD
ncbi:MAG: hypothetical protein ACI9UR_001643 [Bacteroidia bacterium]|jgi:hypothetical protein